jgi:hypothetical protein
MYWPGVRRQRHPTHHWDLRSEGPQRPYPFGADDADLRRAIEKPPERSRGLLIIDLPRTVNPRESADDQRLGRSQAAGGRQKPAKPRWGRVSEPTLSPSCQEFRQEFPLSSRSWAWSRYAPPQGGGAGANPVGATRWSS